MKSLKKFFALALALALCFVMALPAMAAENEETTTDSNFYIKIDGEAATGHTYTVYQIFTGDLALENGAKILSNVKYGAVFSEEGLVSQEALALFGKDGIYANAEDFAKAFMAKDVSGVLGSIKEETPVVTDKLEARQRLDVVPGYYLIVDNGNPNGGENNVNSAYIVQVVGPTDMAPKATVPELDKQVKVEGDENYADKDTVETEIGKTVEFKLTAKIPYTELPKYEHYTMKFMDQMSKGLTFVDGSVEVKVTSPEVADPLTSIGDDFVGFSSEESADNTAYYAQAGYHFVKNDVDDGTAISIEIPNIFNSLTKTELDRDVEVTVTYKAVLNKDAITVDSTGENETNFNKAHLEYSNDPYDEGTGGKTPEDKTFVYSFRLDIVKKASDGDNKVLAGAEFELYASPKTEDSKPLQFIKVGDEYKLYNPDAAGTNFTGDEIKTAQTTIVSDKDGKLNFAGLAAGKYVLVETKAPDGYNLCSPIEITITAKTLQDTGSGDDAVNTPYVVIEMTKNSAGAEVDAGNDPNENTSDPVNNTKFDVLNNKGTLLPSTGGIGTTIFYAVGGVLVVGAGVLLIVKKRLGSKG